MKYFNQPGRFLALFLSGLLALFVFACEPRQDVTDQRTTAPGETVDDQQRPAETDPFGGVQDDQPQQRDGVYDDGVQQQPTYDDGVRQDDMHQDGVRHDDMHQDGMRDDETDPYGGVPADEDHAGAAQDERLEDAQQQIQEGIERMEEEAQQLEEQGTVEAQEQARILRQRIQELEQAVEEGVEDLRDLIQDDEAYPQGEPQ